MDLERLLVEHLPDVERTTAFVCRRNRLRDSDAEEFGSYVKLKLIENDYSILRKFEGRCGIRTYLGVVIHRLVLDFRNHILGKWRPSAEAKRLGARAIALETLLHRDKRTFDEAVRAIQESDSDVTAAELEQLAARLPKRAARRSDVSLDDLTSEPAIGAHAEHDALRADRAKTALIVTRVVRETIERLPDEDRAILRMHFMGGMTIANIARALGVDQKPLYSRLKRHFATLRKSLESVSVTADDIEEMIGSADFDFGFDKPDPDPDDGVSR